MVENDVKPNVIKSDPTKLPDEQLITAKSMGVSWSEQ